MKKNKNYNDENEENGVKKLSELIKLAGDDARATNKRVMKKLSDKLQAISCH